MSCSRQHLLSIFLSRVPTLLASWFLTTAVHVLDVLAVRVGLEDISNDLGGKHSIKSSNFHLEYVLGLLFVLLDVVDHDGGSLYSLSTLSVNDMMMAMVMMIIFINL